MIDCISAGKNLFFTFAIASTDTHREREKERDEGNPLLVVTRWRSVGGYDERRFFQDEEEKEQDDDKIRDPSFPFYGERSL